MASKFQYFFLLGLIVFLTGCATTKGVADFIDSNDFVAAEEYCEKQKDEKRVIAYIDLARAYVKVPDKKKVSVCLVKADKSLYTNGKSNTISREAKNRYRKEIADIYFAIDDYSYALLFYRNAEDFDSTKMVVNHLLDKARAMRSEGKYTDQFEREIVSECKYLNRAEVWDMLGDYFFELKHYEYAIEYYKNAGMLDKKSKILEEAILDGNNASGVSWLISYYENMGSLVDHYQVLIEKILLSHYPADMDKAIKFMEATGVGQERYALVAESLAYEGRYTKEAIKYFNMGTYEDTQLYVKFADQLLSHESRTGGISYLKAQECYQKAGVLESKYEKLGDSIFQVTLSSYGLYDKGIEYYRKAGVLNQKKDEVISKYLEVNNSLENSGNYHDAMTVYQNMLFFKYNIDKEKTNNSVSKAFSDKAMVLSIEMASGKKKKTQALFDYIDSLQRKAEAYKE